VNSTASVTVNPVPIGQPTVSITANNLSALQIQPGQSFTLKWAATNSTACVASGGSGLEWVGVKATSSAGTTIGPINTQGVYTYSLNCTGVGGSGTASVVVTVVSSSAVDCSITGPSVALLTPSASVSSGLVSGACLLGCNVTNQSNVINSSLTDFATVNVPLGIAAVYGLKVDNTTSYPAGRKVGFLLAQPAAVLSLGVIPNVTVRTLLNNVIQESASAANLLTLDAVGLFANPNEGFAGFTTTKAFDAVQIEVGSLVSAGTALRVYGACVSLQ
jgi:hypothetical protein